MKSEFYNELDPEGEKTLEVIGKASRFNFWMYETISPFCQGHVLEIGSGLGNISEFFLNDGFLLTLSDLRARYCEALKMKFSSFSNLESILQIDLVDQDFQEKYQGYKNHFDSIFALNVVEHIENDSLAVQNCHFMLKKGGKLIILVPAFQSLFNQFDKNLGHFRRYNLISLESLLKSNRFEIIHHQYFNSAGILGWYFSGKILNNQTIPEGQMGLYNRLVPVFRIVDKIVGNQLGLSVIGVGETL